MSAESAPMPSIALAMLPSARFHFCGSASLTAKIARSLCTLGGRGGQRGRRGDGRRLPGRVLGQRGAGREGEGQAGEKTGDAVVRLHEGSDRAMDDVTDPECAESPRQSRGA
jgi:hypothetical protein